MSAPEPDTINQEISTARGRAAGRRFRVLRRYLAYMTSHGERQLLRQVRQALMTAMLGSCALLGIAFVVYGAGEYFQEGLAPLNLPEVFLWGFFGTALLAGAWATRQE